MVLVLKTSVGQLTASSNLALSARFSNEKLFYTKTIVKLIINASMRHNYSG